MRNINSLLEKYTKEEFLNSSFQGINCPKWFGIEISCSNNCKSCWEKVIKANNLKFKDERKFKVGDKVVPQNGKGWHSGSEFRIIKEYFEKGYRISDEVGSVWYDEELKLYEEPQTEFTFQEVIARIKPGEVYESNKNAALHIKNGDIVLDFDPVHCNGVIFEKDTRYKLQEPKKQYVLYGIEHGLNRKIYYFRSRGNKTIPDGSFVFCNTKYGNSYGRAVQRIEKELTEKEYLEYKECWRA